MKKVNFLFGIHNHQPVGNFQAVFEDSFRHGYQPFLELLQKYPKVKTTLHFSGILLAWIKAHHPETLARLKELVASGQLEIMTGGFYEPILPVIPDRDKLGQIKKLTRFIQDNLGYDPTGLWLAERVWEPHLPRLLKQAGVKYTILDDTHFKCSGLEDADLDGYYLTEDEGETIALFPISRTLRYTIPFRPVEETIEHLRSLADESGEHLAIYADDGEKFGVWPGTYKHCFTEGWLERFMKALSDNSDWINLWHLSTALQKLKPKNRIYIQTASYMEMTEWALPAPAIEKYEKIVEHLKQGHLWDEYSIFIRGGFWRNFLAKYPETNNMHKKMLAVSAKIEALSREADPAAAKAGEARDYLYRGQCNCPYWHGVFGGLYLPHVRSAIYQNLILAEKIADDYFHKGRDWTAHAVADFDRDGQDELIAESTHANYYFKPGVGAQLFELDFKPSNLNVVDTITRQREGYHSKIAAKAEPKAPGEAVSIHDILRSKEEGLEKLLAYDWYRRGMFIDHFFREDVTPEAFARAAYGEEGDFVNQPFGHAARQVAGDLIVEFKRRGGVWHNGLHAPVLVEKQFIIQASRPEVEVNYQIVNLHDHALRLWYALEFNFGFPNLLAEDVSCFVENETGGPDAKLSQARSAENITSFGFSDGADNFKLSLLLEKKALLWRFPVYSVSLSEGGFEKVQQGVCFTPSWKFRLDRNESWRLKVLLKFKELDAARAESFKQVALARA